MSYVILEEIESGEIIAVRKKQIETRLFSSCFDRFGQEIGSANAGDYFEIKTQEAATKANLLSAGWRNGEDESIVNVNPKYGVGDTVNAWDNSKVFYSMLEMFSDSDHISEIEGAKVAAIVYHDGHNWRTKIIEGQKFARPDLKYAPENTSRNINRAIKNKKKTGEKFGITTYETKKYSIEESNHQGAYEQYKIKQK